MASLRLRRSSVRSHESSALAFAPEERLPRASTATAASMPRSSTAPGSSQFSDMSVNLIRGPLHWDRA